MSRAAAALVASALALVPGCDTAFGTLTLIDLGTSASVAFITGGSPAAEDTTESRPEPGGD